MEIIMRNLCFLLTLVATLLLPGRLIAAALPQDEKLITGQLDNGLRYMIYPHAHPKDQVNLWLQIHTGSLQEEDNERGVAHFVEHMMFNGTKTWEGICSGWEDGAGLRGSNAYHRGQVRHAEYGRHPQGSPRIQKA